MNGVDTPERVSILLVDDRQENLQALAAILERPEYNLVLDRSGEEALELVLRHEFALILLDVAMPTMDGFEVASFIKKRERYRLIPIIFVTASTGSMEWAFKSYSVGAVDFLRKPFDAEVIRAKVSVFVELFRQRQQIRKQAQLLREAERRESDMEIMRLKLESERRYRNLGDAIPHVVWTAGPDGDVQYLNRKWIELTGLTAEDSVGHDWLHVIHPDDRDGLRDAWTSAVQSGKGFELEARLKLQGGAFHWFLVRALPELDEDRHVVAWVGTFTDIDTQRRAQDKAQAAVELRDEFLSVASHELKTPLTALKLLVHGIQRSFDQAPEAVSSERMLSKLTAASRQADRLTALIENLLDVSRIATGRFELNVDEFDLADLVRECVDRMREVAKRVNCDVRLLVKGPVVGRWDRSRLDQVITNLLTNAFKYAPGKPVEVSVGVDHDSTIFSVRDHGIGIDADDQRRIFRRFERAVSNRHYGGLGLGLYIVSQIVESHGGRIEVSSQPQQGAEFLVRLPLVTEQTRLIEAIVVPGEASSH